MDRQEDQKIYLIAGLGNPGRDYKLNRHNIGFMVLDSLADRLGEKFSRYEAKALVTKERYQGQRLILAKPQTYMNESGQAVSNLVRFYKIPLENLLIVYDEVDLPFGTIRIRPNGGSAGHRGIQSIIERMGTEQFSRLRVGIGRPPGRKQAASYVLRDFSTDELEFISPITEKVVEAVLTFVVDGVEKAMNDFNGQVE